MTKYSKKEYNEVFSNAKTILKKPHFYLKISLLQDKKKVIIVISKKNGIAVERNKNKRIIKASLEKLSLLKDYPYTYIVIFPKKPVKLVSSEFYHDCINLKERLDKKDIRRS